MIRMFAISIALVGSIASPSFNSASAEELKMLVGWSSTYPVVELTKVFADGVKQASGGKLTIRTRGPEAVPPFEQLQPVSAGVFELIFTHPSYHSGTTGFALGLDATDPNPEKRRKVGAWDAVDTHYQKHGLKLISLPVSGKDGFVILLKKPIAEDGGLKGRKIRAAPIYHPLVVEFGGTPVVLPANEIYSSLEKGVTDGAAWPIFGPLQFKWYEVAGYLAQPSFGVVTHQIFVNLERWKKLDNNQQQLLLEEGRKLEEYSYKAFSARAEAEIAALKAKGVKVTEFGPAQKQKLDEVWAKGVWGLAEKLNGDDAKKLHELLKKEGMTR